MEITISIIVKREEDKTKHYETKNKVMKWYGLIQYIFELA